VGLDVLKNIETSVENTCLLKNILRDLVKNTSPGENAGALKIRHFG
jgi:hypothetical protein